MALAAALALLMPMVGASTGVVVAPVPVAAAMVSEQPVEFVGGQGVDGLHFASKVQLLSSKLVVEIHADGAIADLLDSSHDMPSIAEEHGDLRAGL